jgi:hypothetical protein
MHHEMKLPLIVLLLSIGGFCGCQRQEEMPPITGQPVNLGQPMKLTPADPVTMVTPAPK